MSQQPTSRCPKCGSTIHRTPDGYGCDNVSCSWEIYEGSFKDPKDQGK